MARTNVAKVVNDRYNGEWVVELRGQRLENISDWHDRIETLDALYRGDWTVVFPGEQSQTLLPHITNLVQVGMDDIARLVSEAIPSTRCYPAGESETAEKNAHLRAAIADGYWVRNDGHMLVPKLAQDISGAGAGFLVVSYNKKESQFPCISRVDPRMAYPDTYNGQIQDLLVIRVIKYRQAARMWPDIFTKPPKGDDQTVVEVHEYYDNEWCIKHVVETNVASQLPVGEPTLVKAWQHKLGMVPVAYAGLDSFDGQPRGMFDQIAGSLSTKNRIVKLMLDYTDRMVYAPKKSKGLLNPDEVDGPNAHYRLDPNVQESDIARVAPAATSPQLFPFLEYLDREQRAGIAYPAQRQGEVNQSIASATFVNATQGQLTSAVRNIQRLIGSMREQVNRIGYETDIKWLDEQKPLYRPIDGKKTYKPSTDIGKNKESFIIYGAGAGLDRQNTDVRVLQHRGAGLISKATAREQIDYLDDVDDEQDQIERENAQEAMQQKFLTEAPWQIVMKVIAAMADGESMAAAVAKVQKELDAAAPEQPAGGPPGPVPGAEEAGATQESLAKGGIPGEAPAQNGPEGAPPAPGGGAGQTPELMKAPLTNILVSPGRG